MKEKSCIRCGYTPVHLGRYCVQCYVVTHEADGRMKEEEELRLKTEEELQLKQKNPTRKLRRRALVKAMNTIKRPAEIGEHIVVVKPDYTDCHNDYKIGQVFTVTERFTASVHTTEGIALWDYEYRVLNK